MSEADGSGVHIAVLAIESCAVALGAVGMVHILTPELPVAGSSACTLWARIQ